MINRKSIINSTDDRLGQFNRMPIPSHDQTRLGRATTKPDLTPGLFTPELRKARPAVSPQQNWNMRQYWFVLLGIQISQSVFIKWAKPQLW